MQVGLFTDGFECRRFLYFLLPTEVDQGDSGGQILSSPRLTENFALRTSQSDPCHPDQVKRKISLKIILTVDGFLEQHFLWA
jgi:hypothetical protein